MSLARRQVLRGVAVAGVGLAGCTGGASAEIERTTDVTMAGSQFDPRNAKVDRGATVTWTNEDGMAHTVTSASDNWNEDTKVAAGEQTTHTFQQSGVYDVYCRYHGSTDLSGMSMKIGVGEATIEAPLGSGGSGGYY